MGGYGFLQGPADIALFTVRQRRTDVAWMGRAFAVSMAFNFLGYPTGAVIAGVLAATSIEASIIVGVAAAVLAAAPGRDDDPEAGRGDRPGDGVHLGRTFVPWAGLRTARMVGRTA